MPFSLHPFITQLLISPPSWLTSGSLIKSSQCQLLRNIVGFSFPIKQSKESLGQVWRLASNTVKAIWGENVNIIALEELSQLELGLLMESEILPDEFSSELGGKGLIIPEDYQKWLLVNHENHLSIYSTKTGLDLKESFATANHLDDQLSERLDFAFDQKLGFLTSSPAMVGTGLQASFNIQLPTLIILKQIHRVFNGISALGLAIKNRNGKPLPVTGSILSISNQTTLGVAEDELLGRLQTVAETLEYHEGNAREALRKEAFIQLLDKVERARGILLHTKLLGTQEALALLSALKLGVEMGLIDFPDVGRLDSLSLRVQPARLQLEYGAELTHTDREAYRAELVRNNLTY